MNRILVVDDDQGIPDSTNQIFESEGYKVVTAPTGGEGPIKNETSFFNPGLFQIKLSDQEGTELLVHARTIRPGMKKTMVTGYATLDNPVVSLNSGDDANILKPVDPGTFHKSKGETR